MRPDVRTATFQHCVLTWFHTHFRSLPIRILPKECYSHLCASVVISYPEWDSVSYVPQVLYLWPWNYSQSLCGKLPCHIVPLIISVVSYPVGSQHHFIPVNILSYRNSALFCSVDDITLKLQILLWIHIIFFHFNVRGRNLVSIEPLSRDIQVYVFVHSLIYYISIVFLLYVLSLKQRTRKTQIQPLIACILLCFW